MSKRDDWGRFKKSPDTLGRAISYRLPPGLREKLAAIARAEGLSLSEISRFIVQQWLEEREKNES